MFTSRSIIPSSPLRSASASSVGAPTPTVPSVNSSSSSQQGVTSRSNLVPRPGSSTPPQKTKARDLLRKHYGLGVGPPPPRPGNSSDPMDLSV